MDASCCELIADNAARAAWARHEVPGPELYAQFVGGKSASPIFLTPAFTHPLQSSFPLEATLNGANGTQAGSLCYTNFAECGAMSEKHPPQAPRTQGNHATG
jgi:hypothetical protein